MTPTNAQESLRIETGKAAFAAAKERQAVSARAAQPPGPGDVFVFQETADYPVDWAVVDCHPEDAQRLRVMPLDDYPQVGSCDVGLRLGTTGRVANARCDFSIWLDASVFESELRTGILTEKNLDHIRRKREQIESGTVVASIAEEEVDGDPEYTRWKERTLRPALKALPQTSESDAVSAAEAETAREGRVIPLRPRERRRPRFEPVNRWLALAATVVLVIGLGGLQEMRRLRTQLAAENQRSAELERQRGELERQLGASGADVEQLREQYRKLEERSQQTVRDLEQERQQHQSNVADLRRKLRQTQASEVDVNLPILRLTGEEARTRGGRPFRLELSDARRVVLMVEVVDPEPYDEYGVRIVDKGDGVEVWSGGGLSKPGSMLRLGLPASMLEPGEYELVIYGVVGGETKDLEESYLLDVVR